jgi:hypothetical protein
MEVFKNLFRSCIISDGALPWAVTYASGVSAGLSQFNLDMGAICPLVWSDLAGVVAIKDRESYLSSIEFSREYLSFGVIREISGNTEQSSIYAYLRNRNQKTFDIQINNYLNFLFCLYLFIKIVLLENVF